MNETQIYDYARQLLEAHGDRAVAEAAQKAHKFEEQNEGAGADLATHRSGAEVDARTGGKLTSAKLIALPNAC